MGVNVQTASGRPTMLDDAAVQQLSSSIRGTVLTALSPGYTEARTLWNAMIDRRPALIVQCASTDDVEQTVRFARQHDLIIAVRGGGHNIAGNALCDDGLVIDLSKMQGVQVDPQTQRARVEAGATLGVVDAETQKHGLATPLGINSTTGIAGLTLGGGFGWLSRRLGLTVDNLISAEMILASGTRAHVSATENPDLFWGIRGGGGNFGIVTSFEFQLHKIGPEVLSGLVIHPLDDAKKVLTFYKSFVESAPEEFVCWFVMRKAPPLPFLPPEWHGKEILALAMCYSGDMATGEQVMKPLRTFGNPIADVVGPHPYVGWQQALDPLLTPGARNYWKSHDFAGVTDGLIDTLIDHARRIPDPQTEIAFAQLGGAISRVAHEATAYNHRDGRFVMNVHGRWADPANDDACIGWARALFQAAAPYSTGSVYVNFMTQDESDRVRAAYGENYDRLVALKNKYDPTNLFRINQNIRPSATATTPAAGVATGTAAQAGSVKPGTV
jgi:FAD/FMN-containing dehydrogenase